jgi:small-conductance mechanosensitive channel
MREGEVEMRYYYRGPDAIITDTHFVWRGPTFRIFAIADLDDVRLERTVTRAPSGAILALAFGLFAVALATGVKFGMTAAIPLVLAVIALAVASLRPRGVHAWEIRARYRAQEVTVYTSPDPRIFNQVTRALSRRMEQRPRAAYGVV